VRAYQKMFAAILFIKSPLSIWVPYFPMHVKTSQAHKNIL